MSTVSAFIFISNNIVKQRNESSLYCFYHTPIKIMKCCQEGNQDTVPRNKFKQNEGSEPLKFKVLSFLGLKEYLIDKYVFSRPEPKYEIQHSPGQLKIITQNDIPIPPQYEQEVKLVEDETHSVYAVSLNLKDRSKYCGTVIYSHGNSSDLSHSFSFIAKFASTFPKFDYLVYDYTGYGKSRKQGITQNTICQDLQVLVRSVLAPSEEIILWGFSLGCYPTARLAGKGRFKGVVLQSALASIYSLFVDDLSPYSTFSNDCFSVLEAVGSISCFLVILHSREDEIVPFRHAEVLFERHRLVSSNPFCFLAQVTALKHNHMHAYLSDMSSNPVRDLIHNYFSLMIESDRLPKGRQFQMHKQIYLNDIPKYEQIEHINVDSRQIKEEPEGPQLRESINFTAVKKEVEFDLDEVTPEDVPPSSFSGSPIKSHQGYFQVSGQARDQTEVSEILPEEVVWKLQE